MNFIDIIIVAWLIFAVLRGYRSGLVRQAASFAGFVLGVMVGGWMASALLGTGKDAGSSLLVALIVVLGFGLLMATIAELLALKLQHRIHLNLAQTVNAVLGAAFSVSATLVLVWLLLSALNRLPLADTGVAINESKAYQVMQRVMPPAPDILGRVNQIITPYGFPQIFVGSEPAAAPMADPIPADVEAAADRARQAVVRIEGYGCGDITTGSGFIASPDYVVTNAHVIAGVSAPVVVRGSEKFRAVPVWFNDRLDIAVLRVAGLKGPVLPLAADAPVPGKSGAVLGYPGGGPLAVVPGVMQKRYTAVGRDIYGKGLVTREIYEIQASIHPGNSGGPFVMPGGTVAGVMFGASTDQPRVSYAITSMEAAGELRQAMTQNTHVMTGTCA